VTLNLNRLNTVVNPLNANCEINSIFFVTKDLFTARQMIEELVHERLFFLPMSLGLLLVLAAPFSGICPMTIG
jgi:hypothetical protein